MYNPFTLNEKNIFVSGASSGIGRAIAIECSRMGATVCISGRNNSRLSDTLNLLEGTEHSMIVADLATDEGRQKIVNNSVLLDGIVHCAGITKTVPLKFSGKEILDEIMQINFYAPALLSQQLLKNKKINKGASVIFISSVAGVSCSWVANSAYSASKGAINGLVKGMALDMAPSSIRVNTINPAMVDTKILSEGSITSVQLEEDIAHYPLKRYGKPEEIAYLAIYLLSDASAWMTGSSLIIDGGYTLL